MKPLKIVAWLIGIGAALGLAGIGVLLAVQEDWNVSAVIIIDAPPEAVWQVLTDTERYPEWNPYISRLEGTLALGETVEIEAVQEDGSRGTIPVVIVAFEPNRKLMWHGGSLPMGRGEHRYILEAHQQDQNGEAQTRLTHSETWSGVIVGKFTLHQFAPFAWGYPAQNKALKERVEGAASN